MPTGPAAQPQRRPVTFDAVATRPCAPSSIAPGPGWCVPCGASGPSAPISP